MPEVAAAAPLAGTAITQLLNNGAKGKQVADINQILNREMQDYTMGRNGLFGANGQPGMFGTLSDNAGTNLNRQNQYLYGDPTTGQTGAFGNLNDLINTIFNPSSVSQAYGGQDPYGQNIPGIQGALQQLQGILPQLQGQSGLASQVFSGGGWTPQSQQGFDNLSPIASGQSAQQQALTGMGNNIFNSNGQSENPLWTSFMNAAAQGITGTNPILQAATQGANKIFGTQGQTGPTNQGIQTALSMLANNGMTNPLSALSGYGQSVLSQNGLTPTGAQGEKAALDVINNAGSTNTTDELQRLGLAQAAQPSLLPIDKAVSMARDQAATDYANNSEAARRQALARGGGAGSNVASGLANQGLADYSDKGSQAEAQAVRDTLNRQQGLQLQQAAQGANMAESGGQLQNTRYGTAANSLGNLEGIAANRFGTGGNFITGANAGANANVNTGLGGVQGLAGLQSQRELAALGLLPQISQTGTNQANVFGNLGLGSNAQNLEALGLGGQFYNNALNSQLGGNNAWNNLLQGQNQYALGAGNLANSGANDMSGILNSILGGNFNASNQGLNRTNSIFGQQQQGINNLTGQQGFSAQQGQNSAQTYQGLINSLLGFTGQRGLQADQTAYANIHPSTNPWANILGSAVTQGLGYSTGNKGNGINPTYAGNDLGGYSGAGPQLP